MNQNVRVRFAPSPTGPLHIGGLRTALFNYLFARKRGGSFIVRIEDTDQTRFVPGAEEYILDTLDWCGLYPDEGPRQGGGFGPYRQSERKELYGSYAKELIRKGHAYVAFDTPEELEELRKEDESRGETFVYDARVRNTLNNSLRLPKEKVQSMMDEGVPYVIRFKFEPDQEVVMQDMIRGEVVVNTSTLDDKVLFKSDGMPTYHLANVVDDNLMAISHVIRGEEWLPSLPLHVSLYRAFGWEHLMPSYAHLPLILKPTGKGKLSKRDGEKGGFPVFPLEWKDPESGEVSPGFREEGYLPEALINMLALLGWNPGTDQEIFILEQLVDEFHPSKVGKSGSRYDPEKAKWFNHQHLQRIPDSELRSAFQRQLEVHGVSCDREELQILIPLIKPRINFLYEIWEQSWFFFRAPESYDETVVRKRWKPETPEMMQAVMKVVEQCDPYTVESLEASVKELIEEKGWGTGAVMNAWRLLLVGASVGPGLFDLAAFLGKKEVMQRMQQGLDQMKTHH
ncbi:MAG: glutamate--tRNA ligase [Bacteroidales bacterium]